jgi:hypothetical protein
MRLLQTLGTLIAVAALSANTGCSKENEEATTTSTSASGEASNTAAAPAAKDVPGKAAEALLALKFHHDS